jgi:hypothetical protein
MRGLARPVAIAACGVFFAGCQTAASMGSMWGYVSQSQSVASLRVLVYVPDRPTCEVSRAKDMKQAASAAWAKLTVPTECRPVVITPAQGKVDYWVFPVRGDVTVGATERDWCMTLRDVLVRYYSVLFVTRCEPVGADFTP